MKIDKSVIYLVADDELKHYKNINEKNEINKIKTHLEKYKLTSFEIINIINNKPKTIILLQLLIDEMCERFTENEIKEILEIFK
ncbi:hypothetical protein NUSPORA_01165 [Nucleospora cyclopteri]